MATISFSGIGTGLDIDSLVSQLVAAERAPTENRITSSTTTTNAKLSAIGSIKSAMSNVQTALNKLVSGVTTAATKTTVGTNAGFTATSTSAASAGRYDIEVVSLAQSHKLMSGAFAAKEAVGHGSLTLEAGKNSFTVDIAEDSTLADVAKAINSATGGKGITATVITADDGQHLVLNAVDTGTAGAMRITASGGDGGLSALAFDPDGDSTMTEVLAATDAVVRIDGLERSASGNTLTDAIDGVTLNLTKANAGETYSLKVEVDTSTTKANIQSFITSFNTLNSSLRSVSNYNSDTDTASTLTGDAMVRGLQQQLRSLTGGNVEALKDLGISIATNGTLTLDSTTLDTALSSDPDKVAAMFGKEGVLAKSLGTLLTSNLDTTSGTLTLRQASLNKQLKDLSSQTDALDRRMAAVETRYKAQFVAMDTLVAQMNSTSSYLTQQLAVLQAQISSK